MKSVSTNEKISYPLANAWSRLFCRIFDCALVLVILIGICYLIFSTDPNSNGVVNILEISYEGWRYFVFTTSSYVLFFFYFIVIPYLWNGKTFFKFLFRIQTCNLIFTKNFFINILKKELLIWMIIGVTNILVGITCFIYGENAIEFLNYLVFANIEANNISYIALSSIFQTIYAIGGIILIVLIVYMFIKNKKRAIQDLISDTAVINLIGKVDKGQDKKNSKKIRNRTNYGLPGEIVPGSLEEIDSL